ncbi:MAG: ParB N-terminal domain-containing protein [Selenomonadaceae bacterium]|nr:ParB N-terminal domain-containing protein [Selenomonadaceae bacterium]
MPKFNMNAVGGGATASELRWVELEHLHADERNSQIYNTGDIESLAASIEAHTLIEPPTVRDLMNGEYVIISGHRRIMAVKKLVEEGHTEFSRIQVAVVIDNDDESVALKLIAANAETRVLTNAEKLAQAQEYMRVMSLYKDRVNLPGKVRDIVAKKMKMSSGALGELLALPNKLHPALLEHFKQGTINQTAAIELSKLEYEDQVIYADWVNEGRDISVKQVRHYRKQKEEEAIAEKAARDEAACPSMFTVPEPKQEQEKEEQEETAPPAPVIAENATTEVMENQEVPPKAEQEDVHQYETSYNDMSHDIRDIMTAMVMIKNACTSLSKYTNCTKCPLFKDNQCSFIHKTKPSYYNWLDGIQL